MRGDRDLIPAAALSYATKDRPCVIIHQRQNEYDETEVFICPVTHTRRLDLRAIACSNDA
jgi:mRNA-degrading endonuclease toxin of MazEF toxin-antitoxin module